MRAKVRLLTRVCVSLCVCVYICVCVCDLFGYMVAGVMYVMMLCDNCSCNVFTFFLGKLLSKFVIG